MEKNTNLDRHVLMRLIQIDRIIRDGKYPNAVSLAEKFSSCGDSIRGVTSSKNNKKLLIWADLFFERYLDFDSFN
ncbi:MAG: hypothetical protein PHV30_06995 [Candidatus Margulisbacteria bacterium]|nr:hypothetical protein [Candidatus Margulisiibacteriota bacterium]